MSTSSDFHVNTVHHDDTDDAVDDHIVENIVRQPINVGQWMLVTNENTQFLVDYKEKHKTRLKTNVKRTVLNNTKLRHF